MTVPISNIPSVWSNSSIEYVSFGLNVNAQSYEANSLVIKANVDGNVVFSVDVFGNLTANNLEGGEVVDLLARPTANAAFDEANTAYTHANNAYGRANDAWDLANTANTAAAAAGGWELAAESQPTSDVGSVVFTGLSAYQAILAVYAIELTSFGHIDIDGRVSAGTWREFMSSDATSSNGDHIKGWFFISNFGIAATHKICAAFSTDDGTQMDASNAIDIQALGNISDSKMSYVSWQEVWDELRFQTSTGNFEGSTSDRRGRFTIYGLKI